MHDTSFAWRTRLVLAGLALALLAAPAWAESTCDICGRPLSTYAVTVMDWQTNREYGYDDLSCAVQAMQARWPWSQAAAISPQFGQRVTLSRTNGTWRAQPDDAVVVVRGDAGCAEVLAFASAEELGAYRKAHPGAISAETQPMPLAELAARTMVSPRKPQAAAVLPPLPSATSAEPPAAPMPAAARRPSAPAPAASKPSLLGYSGLLAAPDARVLPRGTGAAVAGVANREFIGAAALGIGDNAEVAITSRGLEEQMSDEMGETQTTRSTVLYGSAKQQLPRFSRPDLEVAAGLTGLGKRSALYVAGTKGVPLGNRAVDVTAGIGTGGLLDGLFAGLRAPLGTRLLPFAQSADLLVESVNAGAGRSVSFGLDLTLPQGLDLKVGAMDGKPAVGVGVGRGF